MNQLTLLRIRNNLKQSDIATFLNISTRVYSHYETGRSNIPISILHKLADYYNSSIDFLLNNASVKNPYEPISNDKTNHFREVVRACGYPLIEVSKKLNINRETLRRYESGVREIPNDTLINASKLFNISIDYILGRTDKTKPYE